VIDMIGRNEMTRIALSVVLAAGLSGCASEDRNPGLGGSGSGLETGNGLSPNGLMRNGLMRNGLVGNGLTENGLMRNGLLTAEFQGWFDEDPATSAAVMTYLVRCAAPAGQDYAFTSPTTGVRYAWSGSLGLAPGWASGLRATEAEEQVITACLAAHVNRYGKHVDISVLGQSAIGTAIPIEDQELATYSVKEACFYGNLFEDEGIFVGLDHSPWSDAYSSARGCALDLQLLGASADCPPIDNVGKCAAKCVMDPTGSFYTSCAGWQKLDGSWKSYLPITTRILPADVYRCGDGICQFTEHCGTDTTAASCLADCGPCPESTTGTTLEPWAKP
jgi:hypothetical protein